MNYSKKQAWDLLKAMLTAELKEQHPGVPEHAFPKPKPKITSANGLTQAVKATILHWGGFAERTGNQGRYIQATSYENALGNRVQLKPGKWIPGTGTNGTADIHGVFRGTPLAIEIKIGKDRLSEAQKQYREDFTGAGGWYYVCRSYKDFLNDFTRDFELSLDSNGMIFE